MITGITKRLIIYAIITICTFPLWAQADSLGIIGYENLIYNPKVKTVQFSPLGKILEHPVIALRGNDVLELNFDLMGDDMKGFEYTLIHCTADWKPSDLNIFEYIDGFTEAPITTFEFSFNTLQPYVNYRLQIPNNDMEPLLSGNYLLVIYDEEDRGKVYLTRRFCLVEPMVETVLNTKRSARADYFDTHQEVSLEVLHPDLNLTNPFQELKVTLLQNFRWDNAYMNLSPTLIGDEKVVYIREGKYVFPGLKEFRFTDFRDMNTKHRTVFNLSPQGDWVTLFTENIRRFKPYDYYRDANGRYLIGLTDQFQSRDNDREAEYVDVEFTLETGTPFTTGDIFVFGEISDWQANDDYKMTYNWETKAYEASFLLKQGRYDYIYCFVETDTDKVDCAKLEGSWHETENDYQVLVYYRGFADRYDRLVAYESRNLLQPNE